MARGEAQTSAIVFEDGEAIGFRLLGCPGAQALGLAELAREVVIFSEEVTVILSGILLPAHRFDNVLSVKHAY